jgi:uncharacterized protein YhdP
MTSGRASHPKTHPSPPSDKPSRLKLIISRLFRIILGLLFCIPILLVSAWFLLPYYAPSLINQFLKNYPVNVSFAQLDSGFSGLNPTLTISDLRITAKKNLPQTLQNTLPPDVFQSPHWLKAKDIKVEVVLSSLLTSQPIFQRLSGQEIEIHAWQDSNTNFWISGFALTPSQEKTPTPWEWMRQQHVDLQQLNLVWHASNSIPTTLLTVETFQNKPSSLGSAIEFRAAPHLSLGKPFSFSYVYQEQSQTQAQNLHLDIPQIKPDQLSKSVQLPSSTALFLQNMAEFSVSGDATWLRSTKQDEVKIDLKGQIKAGGIAPKSKVFTIQGTSTLNPDIPQINYLKATASFDNWLTIHLQAEKKENDTYGIALSANDFALQKLLDSIKNIQLHLYFPHLGNSLPATLPTTAWVGRIKGLSFTSDQFSFNTPLKDQPFSLSAQLDGIGWKSPWVYFQTQAQWQPANKESRLSLQWKLQKLPLPMISRVVSRWLTEGGTKDWLGSAFTSGMITKASGSHSIVFSNNQIIAQKTSHQIDADISQLGLNYWKTFPAVHQTQAHLRIQKNTSTQQHEAILSIASGKILDYQLKPSEISFQTLEQNPTLLVKANGQGDASNLLRYLKQSPLADKLTSLPRLLSVSGDSHLSVVYRLPFKNTQDMDLSLEAQLNSVNVSIPALVSVQVDGVVGFSKGMLRSPTGLHLQGDWGKLSVSTLAEPQPPHFQIQADVDYNNLLKTINRFSLTETPIQTPSFMTAQPNSRLRVSGEIAQPFSFFAANHLTLDLCEFAFNIPSLIDKKEQDPFELSVTTSKQGDLSLKVEQPASSPVLDAYYRISHLWPLTVETGAIGIGVSHPTPQPKQVIAQIKLGAVDAARWFGQTSTTNQIPLSPSKTTGQPFPIQQWEHQLTRAWQALKNYRGLIPNVWSVEVDEWKQVQTAPLFFNLQATKDHLDAQIEHPDIKGVVIWNKDKSAEKNHQVQMIFDVLRLPLLTQKPDNKNKTSDTKNDQVKIQDQIKNIWKAWQVELQKWNAEPESNTQINIHVDRLLLDQTPMGRLVIDGQAHQKATKNQRKGYDFSASWINMPSIEQQSQFFDMSIQGFWYVDEPNEPAVGLSSQIISNDMGWFLSQWGQEKMISGGTIQFLFDVKWKPHLAEIDKKNLSMLLTFKIGQGNLLMIDSTSIKLLGILSFQNLGRFFDVFGASSKQGVPFDELSGQLRTYQGETQLEKLWLKSPVIEASASGVIDLFEQTQDLKVVVVPKVDLGNFSVLYGLLVNPLVGLGALGLGLFANDAFTLNYHITGTFDQPILTKQ